MKKSIIIIVAAFLFCACNKTHQTVDIIPIPTVVEFKSGVFEINQDVTFEFDESNSDVAHVASLLLKNIKFGMSGKQKNVVALNLNPKAELGDEAYELEVSKNKILITAKTGAGLFYGAQTLLQLAFEKNEIPCVVIKDKPRFAYRGLHLDASRHFAPKEFVKKYIDLLASYKLNRFHWHLTDGAGWRIEIKKYPKLTDIAAWRTHPNWKEWMDSGRQYLKSDGTPHYGGYYTQDDIREIVAYAARKHVTIIPEIEMPGHSEEVCAVYPELSCSGKPYEDFDVCIGNEKTFEFFENVLSEVIELFPSEYIHIGGDEAVKKSWKTCAKCQKRMKEEKLADVDELQSYFVHRIEKFIRSKGRKMIGWDEILEGGIAPEATVMSWRGEDGGIAAARSGHDVIMVPNQFLYLDYYQGNPAKQPESIGGKVTLRKVYSYDPHTDSLTAEQQKHILGVQANIWREFMQTTEHVEYMLLPRMFALAEIAWSPREKKDWLDFRRRVDAHFPMLKARGYNYCPPLNEVEILSDVDYENKKIKVWFDSEEYQPTIYYTTDGSTPTTQSKLYEKPFYVNDSANICAAIFINDEAQDLSKKSINYHKAIGKKITYNLPYDSKRYPAGGDNALIDGYRGTDTYLDKIWQGLLQNLDVIIDLGEETDINKISLCFMQLKMPGIYMPEFVEFYVSNDGENFEKISTDINNISTEEIKLTFKDFVCTPTNIKARYIKVFAKKYSGYMFTDEIIVW